MNQLEGLAVLLVLGWLLLAGCTMNQVDCANAGSCTVNQTNTPMTNTTATVPVSPGIPGIP